MSGKAARPLAPGRRQVGAVTDMPGAYRSAATLVGTRKREHSRKPDEFYDVIEACSPGPRLELFARGERKGWTVWGDQAAEYEIGWETYAHNSRAVDAREWRSSLSKDL